MVDELPKEAFTAEQKEALQAMMGQTVNNILTARLNTVEKKLLEKTSSSIGEALKSQLPELLKDFRAPPESTDDVGGSKGGKKDKDSSELATKLATMAKQQEATLARLDASERKAAQLREQARAAAIRDQTSRFLANAGIVGDAFDAAYAYLAHNGKIKTAEDPDSDEAFFADPAGDVTLEVGLGGWLKTNQAKLFLPATGTRGSNSRPSSGMPNGQKPTPEQVRANIAQALERELGK
jgi:hypothetical protein